MTTKGALDAEGIAQQGIICIWSGEPNNIPSGWVLCDGTPYKGFPIPDLRSCFIVGASNGQGYDKANTRGEASKITAKPAGTHGHSISEYPQKVCVSGACHTALPVTQTANVADHTHDINVANKRGQEDTSELRPKWYALCYILYVGV